MIDIDYTVATMMSREEIDGLVIDALTQRFPRANIEPRSRGFLYEVLRAERVVAVFRVWAVKPARGIPLVNRYGATWYWLVEVT